jgi:hypothetical protein
MTSAAKFLGEQRPELQHPSSDRFIGDVQPALGQQIFDIAEAEGKAKIQLRLCRSKMITAKKSTTATSAMSSTSIPRRANSWQPSTARGDLWLR